VTARLLLDGLLALLLLWLAWRTLREPDLFQAGVHPRTKISELDQEAIETLFHAMKDVLREAIEHQAQPERLPDAFIVPHRHDEGRCPRCGAALETVRVSSRTSYFCPNCQPKEDG